MVDKEKVVGRAGEHHGVLPIYPEYIIHEIEEAYHRAAAIGR